MKKMLFSYKAKRKYIAWADEETGEITGFSHPVIKSKSDLGKVVAITTSNGVVSGTKATTGTIQVLLHLMAKLDFENYLRVTQKRLQKIGHAPNQALLKQLKGCWKRTLSVMVRKLAMLELTVLTHAWLTRAVILKPLSLLLMDSIKPNLLYK